MSSNAFSLYVCVFCQSVFCSDHFISSFPHLLCLPVIPLPLFLTLPFTCLLLWKERETVRLSRFHWCFIITGFIKAIRHIQNVIVFIIGVVLGCLIKIYTFICLQTCLHRAAHKKKKLEWVIFFLCAAPCKHVYTKKEFVGHKTEKFVPLYVQKTNFMCYPDLKSSSWSRQRQKVNSHTSVALIFSIYAISLAFFFPVLPYEATKCVTVWQKNSY